MVKSFTIVIAREVGRFGVLGEDLQVNRRQPQVTFSFTGNIRILPEVFLFVLCSIISNNIHIVCQCMVLNG